MAQVVIHCIPESGADPDQTLAELDSYLRDTDDVKPLVVKVEQPRLGPAEILAVLQIASTAIDLTERLVNFIKSRRNKGKVKDIEIEIDGERISVGNLTQDQKRQLTAAIASGT